MDFKEVKELINIINNSEIAYFEVEKEGIHLKMDKSYDRGESKDVINTSQENNTSEKEVVVNNLPQNNSNSNSTVEDDKDIYIVKSPMVGTFYDSPSIGAEPFVSIGTKVKKGDVVCIIEAMKLMNEILAEESGEIVEILAKREQLVEYGEPLFKVRRG